MNITLFEKNLVLFKVKIITIIVIILIVVITTIIIIIFGVSIGIIITVKLCL